MASERTSMTAEQLQIASTIDARMRAVERPGANAVVIIGEMFDYMPSFKQLIDTTTPSEMDDLCDRFEGFYRYAKILEALADGIESGDIPVPE